MQIGIFFSSSHTYLMSVDDTKFSGNDSAGEGKPKERESEVIAPQSPQIKDAREFIILEAECTNSKKSNNESSPEEESSSTPEEESSPPEEESSPPEEESSLEEESSSVKGQEEEDIEDKYATQLKVWEESYGPLARHPSSGANCPICHKHKPKFAKKTSCRASKTAR